MKNVYLTLRELRHGIILVIEALLIINEKQRRAILVGQYIILKKRIKE